jgi:c-di-GMP-binding flagellar brake protein YcgR
MGVKVGRIVREFLFKGLAEQQLEVKLHARRRELGCRTVELKPDRLELTVTSGDLRDFPAGERVRVYFQYQNNWHTFSSTVLASGEGRVALEIPEGVYKNPQRKYERVQIGTEAEVYFTLKGQKVELNFPRTSRPASSEVPVGVRKDFDFGGLDKLHQSFRERMEKAVSTSRIVMLRDKLPSGYEEKVIAALGKMLWIPSTEEDWPAKDPFPDERVILRRDLVKYEESLERPAHVISSKLGNILYEKQKKGLRSELWCPILYESYIIGYIYLANSEERKERISKELAEWVWEFAKVLSYSLQLSGYFTSKTEASERRYESPIIDISAAGLLFAHPRQELARDLLIHTDLMITVRFPERRLLIKARVRRKLQDEQRSYFGLQFLAIAPEDLAFLFQKLYGRTYTSEEDNRWEGGMPPPPLDLFSS